MDEIKPKGKRKKSPVEFGSGSMSSTLDRNHLPLGSNGQRVKPKPRLDQIEHYRQLAKLKDLEERALLSRRNNRMHESRIENGLKDQKEWKICPDCKGEGKQGPYTNDPTTRWTHCTRCFGTGKVKE